MQRTKRSAEITKAVVRKLSRTQSHVSHFLHRPKLPLSAFQIFSTRYQSVEYAKITWDKMSEECKRVFYQLERLEIKRYQNEARQIDFRFAVYEVEHNLIAKEQENFEVSMEKLALDELWKKVVTRCTDESERRSHFSAFSSSFRKIPVEMLPESQLGDVINFLVKDKRMLRREYWTLKHALSGSHAFWEQSYSWFLIFLEEDIRLAHLICKNRFLICYRNSIPSRHLMAVVVQNRFQNFANLLIRKLPIPCVLTFEILMMYLNWNVGIVHSNVGNLP